MGSIKAGLAIAWVPGHIEMSSLVERWSSFVLLQAPDILGHLRDLKTSFLHGSQAGHLVNMIDLVT